VNTDGVALAGASGAVVGTNRVVDGAKGINVVGSDRAEDAGINRAVDGTTAVASIDGAAPVASNAETVLAVSDVADSFARGVDGANRTDVFGTDASAAIVGIKRVSVVGAGWAAVGIDGVKDGKDAAVDVAAAASTDDAFLFAAVAAAFVLIADFVAAVADPPVVVDVDDDAEVADPPEMDGEIGAWEVTGATTAWLEDADGVMGDVEIRDSDKAENDGDDGNDADGNAGVEKEEVAAVMKVVGISVWVAKKADGLIRVC